MMQKFHYLLIIYAIVVNENLNKLDDLFGNIKLTFNTYFLP